MKIKQSFYYILLLTLSNLCHAEYHLAPRDDENVTFDLFSGSVYEKNHTLYLKRCDVTEYEYPLNFYRPQDEQRLHEILKTQKKFWIEVTAGVYEREDIYHLHIGAILEEHLATSCHSTDMFDELEKAFAEK